MPANVEIKARLEDFDVFHTLFKKVYSPKEDECKTLEQCDTFFKCSNGRLKLREIKWEGNDSAELIFYDRSDVAGPKKSDFVLHRVQKDFATLKDALVRAHGKRGEIKKTRLLYMVDQTRVHIDKVEGIGQFVELEVVLREKQTAEEGKKIAEEIMEKLNITSDMLIEGSYIDLAADAGIKENGAGSEEKKKSADAQEDKEMEEVKEPAKDTGDAKAAPAESKPASESTETKKATDEAAKSKPEEVKEAKDKDDKPAADEAKEEVKPATNGDTGKPKEQNGDNKDDKDGEKMDTDEAATEKTVEKAADTPAGEVAVHTNTET